MQDGGWAWGLLTPLMIFIVFAAIIVGIAFLVILVRRLWGHEYREPREMPEEDEASSRRETPIELVERRYAAGEIDRREYLQKLKDLGPSGED